MRNKHAETVHRKQLRRDKRQTAKRHETWVKAHGNLAKRQAKNLAKHPSFAGPDDRPSIRGKDWTPPVADEPMAAPAVEPVKDPAI